MRFPRGNENVPSRKMVWKSSISTPTWFLRSSKLGPWRVLVSPCRYWNGFDGAGFQWWYPNFCPAFVLCLTFVQHTSSICLNFVPVKHLSNICPRNPTFALGKSNLCPYSPTYVLFLSSVLAKIHQKLEDKTWSYVGLENFLIWHLVTLHLDRKWTISRHEENQHLSTFCPRTEILP